MTRVYLSVVVRRWEAHRDWILGDPIHSKFAQSPRIAILVFQLCDEFPGLSQQWFGEWTPRGDMHRKRVGHLSVPEVPVYSSVAFKLVTDPACNANDFALNGDCGAA